MISLKNGAVSQNKEGEHAMNHQLLFKYLLVITLFTSYAVTTRAQYTYATSSFKIKVTEASVIKITPATPITVYMQAITAGSSLTNSTNSSSYLKITSIVASGARRKVEAAVTTGDVPAGTLLKLVASPCTTGSGTFGSVDPQITLAKNVNKRLIYNIGSCYTGIGTTDGYNLTYSWELDPNSLSQLTAFTTTAAFITFTISSQW